MKRSTALVLLAAVLLCLTGCRKESRQTQTEPAQSPAMSAQSKFVTAQQTQDSGPTTDPAETTPSPETTAPPETTEPTLPLFPDATYPNEPADPLVLAWGRTKTDFRGDSGQIEYLYNAGGQLVSKKMGFQEEAVWYTYHDNGKLQSETIYQFGKLYQVVEYDTHGTMIRRGYANENGAVTVSEEWICQYDGQGRITSQEYRGDSSYTALYTYYDNGSYEIDHTSCFYNTSGEVSSTWHRVAYFRADGRMTSQRDEGYSDKPESRNLTTWVFDEHGNPKSRTMEYTGASHYSLYVDDYRNQYNEAGQLILTEVYSSEYMKTGSTVKTDNPLTYQFKTEYTYDDQGNLIRKVDIYPTSEEYETVWKYDAWGNLLYFKGTVYRPELEVFLNAPMIDSYYSEETYQYLPLSQAQMKYS